MERLVLQEQIGVGATGKVYRAADRSTSRPVAVKFLRKAARPRAGRDRAVPARVANRGRPAASRNRPRPRDRPHARRRLLPGDGTGWRQRSARRAKRRAGFSAGSAEQAAAWVAAAARIVHAAHERGIIHCDLKPSNLLLDQRGRIRVTDFGLAVRLADDEPGRLMAGTPAFMAPEQVDRCWGPLSPRTDVWGLGAVLYFLLFGQPPHTGENVADVLARVVSGKPVAFPSQPDCEPALIDLCRRCLQKRPERDWNQPSHSRKSYEMNGDALSSYLLDIAIAQLGRGTEWLPRYRPTEDCPHVAWKFGDIERYQRSGNHKIRSGTRLANVAIKRVQPASRHVDKVLRIARQTVNLAVFQLLPKPPRQDFSRTGRGFRAKVAGDNP